VKHTCIFFACLAWSALSGCSGPRRAAPVGPLDQTLTPAPLTRRISVIALADPRWQLLPDHRERIGERIDAASDQLSARVGMQLELRSIQPWNTPVPTLPDALDALAKDPVGKDADLVILFTARTVDGRATIDRLEASRYAGRHAVIRSLTPYLGETPIWLHAAEVVLIERAIARIHGALRICGQGVMGDGTGILARHASAWRWHPRTLALMRAHAKISRKQRRLTPAGAQAALKALESTGACDRVAVDERRAVLRALAKPPESRHAAQVAEGEALLEKGQAKAALGRCAPVAEREPELAAGCAGRASAALDDHEGAAHYLRAHLAHHPDDQAAVLMLAKAIGRNGDDGAARSLLARYVEAHPTHLEARVNLGIAMARLGDYPGARAQWEAVLAVKPDHPAAKRLLQQLP
jgi:thioredoxin-like negative regulator of GroEL